MFDRLKQLFAYNFLGDFLSSKGRSPSVPYVFNLNNKPSCQTLSNALEMSKKFPLTSIVGLSSKADRIACIMDSSWAMHESPGIKLDWEGVQSLLRRK